MDSWDINIVETTPLTSGKTAAEVEITRPGGDTVLFPGLQPFTVGVSDLADAYLIAAAPELLAELESAAHVIKRQTGHAPRAMLAAIAKAKGRDQT